MAAYWFIFVKMNLCIYIVLGIILLIIVFLLLLTVFRKKPNDYIFKKTKGGQTGNVKRNVLNEEEYLNTSIEAYARIIGDTLMFKLGVWGEKSGESWKFENNTMNGGFGEFDSHKNKIKKFDIKYSPGITDWEHVCLYSTFGDSFTSVRNSNLDIGGQQASAYLAGELEILGHYTALCYLADLSENNLIIMSDNNLTLVDDYSVDKSYYDLLNNDLDTLKAAKTGRKLRKYGDAKRLEEIKTSTDFAVDTEFYVCKINPSTNINLKQLIFNILAGTIENFRILQTSGNFGEIFLLNGIPILSDIMRYKSRDEKCSFYDVIKAYIDLDPGHEPHFYISSIQSINMSTNISNLSDNFTEYTGEAFDINNLVNNSIMNYITYIPPTPASVSEETFKNVYPFIGNNDADYIISTLVNYINSGADIEDDIIKRTVCLYCLYRLGYNQLFISKHGGQDEFTEYQTLINLSNIPIKNPKNLIDYCSENYENILKYYIIFDILNCYEKNGGENLGDLYGFLCEKFINDDPIFTINEILKLYYNLFIFLDNITEFCDICGKTEIDDGLDGREIISIAFEILCTEELDYIEYTEFLALMENFASLYDKYEPLPELYDEAGVFIPYSNALTIYLLILTECLGNDISNIGYSINIQNLLNLFDAELDYVDSVIGIDSSFKPADMLPWIQGINTIINELSDENILLSCDDFILLSTEYITHITTLIKETNETAPDKNSEMIEILISKFLEYIEDFDPENVETKEIMDEILRWSYTRANYNDLTDREIYNSLDNAANIGKLIPIEPNIIPNELEQFIILLTRYSDLIDNIQNDEIKSLLLSLNVCTQFLTFINSQTETNKLNDLNSAFGYLINIIERYKENPGTEEPINLPILIEYFNAEGVDISIKAIKLEIINAFLICCYRNDDTIVYFTNAIQKTFEQTDNLDALDKINLVYAPIVQIISLQFYEFEADEFQTKLLEILSGADIGTLREVINLLSPEDNEVTKYIQEILSSLPAE